MFHVDILVYAVLIDQPSHRITIVMTSSSGVNATDKYILGKMYANQEILLHIQRIFVFIRYTVLCHAMVKHETSEFRMQIEWIWWHEYSSSWHHHSMTTVCRYIYTHVRKWVRCGMNTKIHSDSDSDTHTCTHRRSHTCSTKT